MTKFSILILQIILSLAICTDSLILHHSVILGRKNPSENVILLHGLLGSSRNFRTFSSILYEKLSAACNLIVIDSRNHGRTLGSGGHVIDYRQCASDCIETLEFLNIRDAVHLVGHSMGGKIAAATALMHPTRVKSLSIMDISPIAYSKSDLSSVTDTVEFLKSSVEPLKACPNKDSMNEILSSFTQDVGLRSFLASNLQPLENGGYAWKYHVDELHSSISNILDFPSADIKQFGGPTLVLKAGNSDFVKTKHVPSIQNLFPRYTLATLRGSGHWLHSEKPNETADAIQKFIASAN